mgnify:CR=1 FL=1
MIHDSGRELTPDERGYLSAVYFELRGLPRRSRHALLQTVRQNFAERPACHSQQELEGALGPASSYAAELLAEADRAEPGSIARARRRLRTRQILIALLAVVVVTAGVLGYRWWVKWQPEFTQSTAGMYTGPDRPPYRTAAFTTESNIYGDVAQIVCRPGTTVTIMNSIGASPAVTLTGAELPTEGIGQMYRADGIQPWPRGPNKAWPTGPVPSPVVVGDDSDQIHLHMHLTLRCPRQLWSPGTSLVLDHFTLHYRALGRNRTAEIPLMEPLQIVMPGG